MMASIGVRRGMAVSVLIMNQRGLKDWRNVADSTRGLRGPMSHYSGSGSFVIILIVTVTTLNGIRTAYLPSSSQKMVKTIKNTTNSSAVIAISKNATRRPKGRMGCHTRRMYQRQGATPDHRFH